jgi:RNA polymerase sigma-70 factor (ECF subfamily)
MITRLRSRKSQDEATATGASADDLPDAQLANLLTHGSEHDRRTAFDAIYYRYVDAVHGYAFRRLGTREAAEDATSDVFHQIVRALQNYRQQPNANFRSWLFTIAHHVIADHQRRQIRDRSHYAQCGPDVHDHNPSPAEIAEAGDDGRWIRSLLRDLPPRERQVIELDLAGLKTGEIASVLNLSTGAVHTARSRALDHLRAQVNLIHDAREARCGSFVS